MARTKVAGNVIDAVSSPMNGLVMKASDPITAVTSGPNGTFTLAGPEDLTATFFVGRVFTVSGSTGNDGTYTVQSSVYSSSPVFATVITVTGTIPSATADGVVDGQGINLNGTIISNSATITGTNPNDLATVNYVDTAIAAGGFVAKSGDTMTGALTISGAANGLTAGGWVEAAAQISSATQGFIRAYLGGDSANDDMQIGSLNAGIQAISFWNSGGGFAMDLGCRTITMTGTVQASSTSTHRISSNDINAGSLELGRHGNGNRFSFVDFHSHGTPASIDFSARIIRSPGSNADLTLQQTGSGNITFSGGSFINAGSHRIINVSTPSGGNDAATKAYVDGAVAGGLTFVRLNNSTVLTSGNLGWRTVNISGHVPAGAVAAFVSLRIIGNHNSANSFSTRFTSRIDSGQTVDTAGFGESVIAAGHITNNSASAAANGWLQQITASRTFDLNFRGQAGTISGGNQRVYIYGYVI